MKVCAGGKILKLKADHFKIGLLVIVLVSKLFGFSKLNFQAWSIHQNRRQSRIVACFDFKIVALCPVLIRGICFHIKNLGLLVKEGGRVSFACSRYKIVNLCRLVEVGVQNSIMDICPSIFQLGRLSLFCFFYNTKLPSLVYGRSRTQDWVVACFENF